MLTPQPQELLAKHELRPPLRQIELPQSSGQNAMVRSLSSPNSWPASSIGTPGTVMSATSPSRAFCSASSHRVG